MGCNGFEDLMMKSSHLKACGPHSKSVGAGGGRQKLEENEGGLIILCSFRGSRLKDQRGKLDKGRQFCFSH